LDQDGRPLAAHRDGVILALTLLGSAAASQDPAGMYVAPSTSTLQQIVELCAISGHPVLLQEEGRVCGVCGEPEILRALAGAPDAA
jgi:hypothetical protein